MSKKIDFEKTKTNREEELELVLSKSGKCVLIYQNEELKWIGSVSKLRQVALNNHSCVYFNKVIFENKK